jgi:hypothetical protein
MKDLFLYITPEEIIHRGKIMGAEWVKKFACTTQSIVLEKFCKQILALPGSRAEKSHLAETTQVARPLNCLLLEEVACHHMVRKGTPHIQLGAIKFITANRM